MSFWFSLAQIRFQSRPISPGYTSQSLWDSDVAPWTPWTCQDTNDASDNVSDATMDFCRLGYIDMVNVSPVSCQQCRAMKKNLGQAANQQTITNHQTPTSQTNRTNQTKQPSNDESSMFRRLELQLMFIQNRPLAGVSIVAETPQFIIFARSAPWTHQRNEPQMGFVATFIGCITVNG